MSSPLALSNLRMQPTTSGDIRARPNRPWWHWLLAGLFVYLLLFFVGTVLYVGFNINPRAFDPNFTYRTPTPDLRLIGD